MRLFLIVGCIALPAVGCGSGSGSAGTGLTCDWLASDANCWKNTLLMATSCLPAETEMGTFSVDASTCTYASGQIVTFMPKLTLPLPAGADMKWNFTVTGVTGQPCLHYVSTDNGQTLTVGNQTVSEALVGLGLSITCPDGTKVGTSNGLSIFQCGADSGAAGGIPGVAWSSSGSAPPYYVSAGLVGGGDMSVSVFNCMSQ